MSGKGVSAALLMANVQATLRARLPLQDDLAALADLLDRELDASTPGGVFVTLFLAILDDSHELRYVNAGHNPQYVLRGDGSVERLSATGLPIGLFGGHGYKEKRVSLAPGDLLFFFTDGLSRPRTTAATSSAPSASKPSWSRSTRAASTPCSSASSATSMPSAAPSSRSTTPR